MPIEGEPIVKKLEGNNQYWVRWNGMEFLALNFISPESKEALANFSAQGVGAGYNGGQTYSWLVIGHGTEMGAVPDGVYAQKAAEALSAVLGARVDPSSIVTSRVDSDFIERVSETKSAEKNAQDIYEKKTCEYCKPPCGNMGDSVEFTDGIHYVCPVGVQNWNEKHDNKIFPRSYMSSKRV
jgi:hypothetical protein